MTTGLHDLIDNRLGQMEDPRDFTRLVAEFRDTGEQIRRHEVVVTDQERKALAHAANILTVENSPVRDELDTLVATGAVSAVVDDPEIEAAFAHLLDKNFPIGDTIPEPELTANELSRQQFEEARHTTDANRSYGSALIAAAATAEITEGQGTESELINGLEDRGNTKTLRVKKVDPRIRQQIRDILYSTDESDIQPSGRYSLFRSNEPYNRVVDYPAVDHRFNQVESQNTGVQFDTQPLKLGELYKGNSAQDQNKQEAAA